MDNSRNWDLALDYKPVRAMTLRLWHEWSERGPDYQSIGGNRVGLPYLETIEWSNVATGFEAGYLITGGVQVNASLTFCNVEGHNELQIPAHLYGQTTTFSGGIVLDSDCRMPTVPTIAYRLLTTAKSSMIPATNRYKWKTTRPRR
ncbi:MAG: hypothetical protein U5L72_17200 [Bacteroidales bacterium]|nr:hypothetical protein [Bacteroidales bacterium]